jgi:hemerythrin superfamily protein
VVDWEEGVNKYTGQLGALVCESADGKVVVNVGSGLSDKQRKKFKPEFIIGKIVEITYNEKIAKKDSDIFSLFLPRFMKIRDDKNVANDFEEIL